MFKIIICLLLIGLPGQCRYTNYQEDSDNEEAADNNDQDDTNYAYDGNSGSLRRGSWSRGIFYDVNSGMIYHGLGNGIDTSEDN